MESVGKTWGKFDDDSSGAAVPPRYCLRCQELLPWTESEPGQCFQCGLQFDPAEPATYREGRTFLRWKFWFPGFCLAVASGVISYVICLQSGELGMALFFAVPVSVGAILGYGTRVHVWLLGLLGLAAITCIVVALVSMHWAGFFCGMTLSLIFVVPTAAGIFLGVILRLVLARSRWDQRWFFPLWAFLILPYAVQAIENRLPHRTEIASVRTELTVDATPQQAWDAIMFYEQVQHQPPWLLRLALPKPIRSEGSKQRVGEVVRCYYDRGHLAKRISRREEGRLLAFDVIEQHLHFERDVVLCDGSFAVVPVEHGRSRIVLTTRYERKLAPRWLWEATERKVIHTLHGHVLEGMRRKAEGRAGKDGRPIRPVNPPYRNNEIGDPPSLTHLWSTRYPWFLKTMT
jgi:hypothetical protein